MDAISLTVNTLNKVEMEYHGKFVHTLYRIQRIDIISRIENLNATCHISTQTVSPTLPDFQGINLCVQYLASCPHKVIFYPSNDHDGLNVIIRKLSGN